MQGMYTPVCEEQGYKHIIQAKVVVGYHRRGKDNEKQPVRATLPATRRTGPLQQQIKFDSLTGGAGVYPDNDIFVTFSKEQCYISYYAQIHDEYLKPYKSKKTT